MQSKSFLVFRLQINNILVLLYEQLIFRILTVTILVSVEYFESRVRMLCAPPIIVLCLIFSNYDSVERLDVVHHITFYTPDVLFN